MLYYLSGVSGLIFEKETFRKFVGKGKILEKCKKFPETSTNISENGFDVKRFVK